MTTIYLSYLYNGICTLYMLWSHRIAGSTVNLEVPMAPANGNFLWAAACVHCIGKGRGCVNLSLEIPGRSTFLQPTQRFKSLWKVGRTKRRNEAGEISSFLELHLGRTGGICLENR